MHASSVRPCSERPSLGITAGSEWEQTLYQQLRQCQAVIALLTPSWLESRWCFAEVVQARERGKAIFLVKVKSCDASTVFADVQQTDLVSDPVDGYRRLKRGLLERGLDPSNIFGLGFSTNVETVAFSPDNRTLAAGFSDGMIRMSRGASDEDVAAQTRTVQSPSGSQ
jgi:TIR domain